MSEPSLQSLLQLQNADAAWVRVLVQQDAGRWVLRYCYATLGGQPPSWTGETWRYAQFAFISERIQPERLISAISSDAEGVLHVGGLKVEVPRSQDRVQTSHLPGFALHDPDRTEVPSFDISVSRADGAMPVSTAGRGDFLVGPDSPTFTDLDAAYRAFFLGKYELPANASLPSELMRFRVLDKRAWLGPVHISATDLTVDVRGSQVSGMTVEYFSPDCRERVTLSGPDTVRITLPNGLPGSNAWLWLTRGTEWSDYRALTPPWGTADQLAAAGVRKEGGSRDSQAEIEALVYGGEGPFVEFKGQLPQGKGKADRAFNTVAAFANGDGGTVIFGVDRDESTLVGLGAVDVNKERDRIGQLIRSRVLPTPDFEVTAYRVADEELLVLLVRAGQAPPYGVITDSDSRDKPQFYVRRGASTYPAQPSDLNQIFQRVAAAQQVPGWQGY